MEQTAPSPSMPSPDETMTNSSMVHELDMNEDEKGFMSKKPLFIGLCIAVLIGGVATGAGLQKLQANGKLSGGNFEGQPIQKVAEGTVKNGQVFGSANEKDFKDSAEGFLQAGGIDGEGSHSLLRDGGTSQTVYLTSSVTDLSKFEGMRIKVWGETFKGQKAGWLMDVGRVQVIETKAQAPIEATQQSGSSTAAEGGGE